MPSVPSLIAAVAAVSLVVKVAPTSSSTTATAITANTTVGVTVAGAALSKIDASQEAAIILEVCFYADNAAPTSDDIALPYPTESGQSSA